MFFDDNHVICGVLELVCFWNFEVDDGPNPYISWARQMEVEFWLRDSIFGNSVVLKIIGVKLSELCLSYYVLHTDIT